MALDYRDAQLNIDNTSSFPRESLFHYKQNGANVFLDRNKNCS